MGSIAHTVPHSRPCHRSLYSDFSLGFHPQKLAAEPGWLFGKENSACPVLLAPSSANPKATQSLQQGAGERWWREFLLTHVRVRVSSPWPVDMKDILGFPIRRQERRGASSSPVVRGKILGLPFQVDHCLCCCEHCYIIRLKKNAKAFARENKSFKNCSHFLQGNLALSLSKAFFVFPSVSLLSP